MSEVNGANGKGPHAGGEGAQKINGCRILSQRFFDVMRLRGKLFARLEGELWALFRDMIHHEMTLNWSDITVDFQRSDPAFQVVHLFWDSEKSGERELIVWFWEPSFNAEKLPATTLGRALTTECDWAVSDVTVILDDSDERQKLLKNPHAARELSERLKREVMARWKLRDGIKGKLEDLSSFQGAIPDYAWIWLSVPEGSEVGE